VSAVAESSVLADAGITHVSASSLNRFMRCQESYRQRYCMGVADPAGPKALMGTADSKAFADYYTARIGGGPGVELGILEDIYRDTILAEVDRGEYMMEDETTATLIDSGIPTVRAYYAVAKTMPDPVAVEQRIEIVRENLPLPIIGFTDVEFEAMGIDRKGAATKSVHPDWRIQNRIYSAAKSKPWGWHVTTRTKTPAVYTPADGEQYEEPWSAARAEKTIRFVGQMIGSIEANLLMFGPDSPWPTTGISHTWSCAKCSYRKNCVAWS
jgi:hypothetical protein